jgi:hypothetical protein
LWADPEARTTLWSSPCKLEQTLKVVCEALSKRAQATVDGPCLLLFGPSMPNSMVALKILPRNCWMFGSMMILTWPWVILRVPFSLLHCSPLFETSSLSSQQMTLYEWCELPESLFQQSCGTESRRFY